MVQNYWILIQDWLLNEGARVALTVVLALIAYRLLGLIIDRAQQFMVEIGTGPRPEREQRASTLGGILHKTGLTVIFLAAVFMILDELGLNIAPLLAGTGIVGLAVGFGGQTLVEDVISGFFILMENQFAEGDAIEVNDVSGVVEKLALRSTFLRDVEGTLHIVPNGEIRIVSNRTKTWSRAVVRVDVDYAADVEHVLDTLQSVGQELREDEVFGKSLTDEPAAQGPEELGESAMAFRLLLRTNPGEQWDLAREVRKRILRTFEREGIEMPYPTYAVRLESVNRPSDEGLFSQEDTEGA